MATTSADRILSLDVIRGVAVMGIFSVNVIGMAMIEYAYFYPPAFGFERRQVVELCRQIEAAILQRSADAIEAFAKKRGIEHFARILL